MIISLGNVKGGVGKTTLAVNLAIALSQTQRVLLIDGDEQGTSLLFTKLRTDQLGKAGYGIQRYQGAELRSQVLKFSQEKIHDHIIIDVGGRDTNSLRAALTVSDVLLIPAQPRSFDIWAVDQMSELVKEARHLNPKLKALAILNAADPQGKDNEEAAEAIKGIDGIDLLPVTIGRRKAFPNVAATGQGITEQTKDRKALQEMKSLIKTLDI